MTLAKILKDLFCWHIGDEPPEHDGAVLPGAPITIESAREAAAPLLRGERDGWVDLPCGGSVLIESGRPVRLSTGPADGAAKFSEIASEASEALGMSIGVGAWEHVADGTEITAPAWPAEDQ